MKLSGDYHEWTVTQTALGQILDLTPGRINQLIDEKIVTRKEGTKGAVFLVESMQNYYLSKKSYEDKKSKVNFWEERGLHERAKRKMAELKLRKMEGEVYEAAYVESFVVECVTNFRNKLLGIPSKLSKQLEGKTVAQIFDILIDEINENLWELSQNLERAKFDEGAFEETDAD